MMTRPETELLCNRVIKNALCDEIRRSLERRLVRAPMRCDGNGTDRVFVQNSRR